MIRMALITALMAPSAWAAIDFRGVNLSAAEFGYYGDSPEGFTLSALPGIYNQDYVYAGPEYFDYFRFTGMNIFRIPLRWERIQPVPGAALDAAELGRLDSVVNYATSLGASVIVDIHNYGRFHTDTGVSVLGAPELSHATFSDLWTRLSMQYAANDRVIFGLMNEPYGMTTENVVAFSNDAIHAIRTAGATNLILVQGNGYSGGHSWHQSWYGTPNAEAMLDIYDPIGNLAFEVHQYVNNEGVESIRYSGLTDHVESATVVPEQLAGFTDWLRENNRKGFLGEIGTPSSELGVLAMLNGIDYIELNDDVWMGWALWAGGPWWDNPSTEDPNVINRYHLSVNPYPDGSMAPQLEAISPYLIPEPSPPLLSLFAAAALIARKISRPNVPIVS